MDWQKQEVFFMGIKMNFLQFLFLFLGWNGFLCFIWPIIIGSYFFIFPFLAMFTVILTGIVFKSMIWLLLLLHWISYKITAVFHVVVLVFASLLVIWAYSWFVPTNGLAFFDCYVINLFSAYLLSRFITESGKEDVN